MAVVRLKVGGRDYQVACDDGQEEHLRILADEVDDRVRSLTYNATQKPSEGMALLMAALMLSDELIEKKKENESSSRSKSTSADYRFVEMEAAMAVTLEEIALRIERIADQIEMN
ncbi:MAG: cell division protein ZapA [Rickettsiales bacterium]|nr:cell division protein ZapA [Rickettsiales bacterium]